MIVIAMKRFISSILLIISLSTNAQETMDPKLPYARIPDAPSEYTAATVTTRMIDGLGFRFYWATEGLTEEDFKYKVSQDGRSIGETMDHVYGLSLVVLNSAKKIPNDRTVSQERPKAEDLRAATLKNIKMASDLIMDSKDLSQHMVVFKNQNGTTEFPFWNQINGPIEDAVWHTGQIVMMRRAAGNPFNTKVSLLRGTVRE